MSNYNRRDFFKKLGGALGISLAGFVTPAISKDLFTKGVHPPQLGTAQLPDEDGFVSIFDGTSLDGWHMSAKTGHSSASNHTSGGEWKIEQGAIWGGQDTPGNGGIIITDKQSYSDFEVALEMKNDFGPDSGLFMRSTEDGTAYQCNIDYRTDGTLGGLYGEGGLGGNPNFENFHFGDTPYEIKETEAPTPLPVLPQAWTYFWRHGQWNEIRARITGNPPRIQTWVNGVNIMDWTDEEVRHSDEGGIALQVHGGGNTVGEWVRYRKIRVKEF